MRYLLILLLFTGCVLPREIRKANRAKEKVFRLAEKYDLSDVQVVKFTDTIYVDALQVDTFAVFRNDTIIERDTIQLTKDRVKVELIRVRDSLIDTVYVDVYCPPDTVFYTNTIEVTTPIVKEAEVILWKIWKGIRRFWWLLLIIIVSIFVVSKYGSFRK